VIDEAQANQQTFAHAETICQEMRTQVPARRKAAVQGHIVPGPPSPFHAAIENWRMLQPGRPKRATAILELIAACLSATPDHPRCPDRDAGRNRKAPPEGRPVDAFGVKVAKGYGSIAKTHQRPTHAARWAFECRGECRR